MNRFKNILCVIKTSEKCNSIMDRAISLAENNQAKLTVIEIVEKVSVGIRIFEGAPAAVEIQNAMNSSVTKDIEILISDYQKKVKIQTKVLAGTPFLEIIREVIRNNHDLVIKAPENLDWLDHVFGSDDMHLLRKCPCPVWLIKPQAPASFKRIMAAIDVDDTCPPAELKSQHVLNQQIIEMAGSLALSNFAELHIGHAWEAIGENILRGPFMHSTETEIIAYTEAVRMHHKKNLDTFIQEWSSQMDKKALDYLEPRTHLVEGPASKEIPLLAKRINADLIVMGTVARTGIPGFIMGNTAETILKQIDCSVLAIKPPGFITPVRVED